MLTRPAGKRYRDQVAPRGNSTFESVVQDMDDAAWRDRRFTEPEPAERTLTDRLQAQQEAQQRVLEAEVVPEALRKRKKRADGLPSGDKPGMHEVMKRRELAEIMIAEIVPRHEFVRRMMAEVGVESVRTADRYRQEAVHDIQDRREAERAHDVSTQLHRWTHLSRKYEREGDRAGAIQAQAYIARITGVMQPERLDVRAAVLHAVAPQPTPEIDPTKLNTAARTALRAYLLAVNAVEESLFLEATQEAP